MKNRSFTVLDGAMGTMLQKAGLPTGYHPEKWNIEHPEKICEVAKKYIAAGSDVIYTNTFGANRKKLKDADLEKVIFAGVKAAKEAACGTETRVALDIGPIGQLLEPLGTLKFDEAYDIFREICVLGERAGADLIVFETMSDLLEVKAGVLAAKENTKLPVWVTMTFEESGRTFLGVTVPSMALTLEGLGVDAVGFNCSLGPRELLPLVKTLGEWCDLPLILKPNAGLPDPEMGEYSITPEEFAQEILEAASLGVTIFGGCCGTNPEFIKALSKNLEKLQPTTRERLYNGVCSATRAVPFGEVRVVGERINPTGKKRFQQALREGEISYILEQGISQENAGADILDVNVGMPGIDETTALKSIVKELQSVIDLPLQIDSSDTQAIEAALRCYNGKPIVNSVNGDKKSLSAILPLCKKYGAAVVGLTMDSEGIPKTSKKRIEIAKNIVNAAEKLGIRREDIIIDCLTLTVSAEQSAAAETLKAVRYVSQEMGLETTLGVSNISFGLPCRKTVTTAFLSEALSMGLSLPIINPNESSCMDAVFAHKVLSCEDENCEEYITRFSTVTNEVPHSAETKDLSIETAVQKGLREETAMLTRNALKTMGEIEVINTMLIPALDAVGKRYEKGEIFLPQLINSANAASEGFEIIKKSLCEKGEANVSRGKIVVATVKGDIHDIGKNIVKVVLENYGYTVIDLGRDVEPEKIVKEVKEKDVKLVGLSALMTTTVVSMKETVKALRKSGHDCMIWVGGAVLTPQYAEEIGADFYAKDATDSVHIAEKVLG